MPYSVRFQERQQQKSRLRVNENFASTKRFPPLMNYARTKSFPLSCCCFCLCVLYSPFSGDMLYSFVIWIKIHCRPFAQNFSSCHCVNTASEIRTILECQQNINLIFLVEYILKVSRFQSPPLHVYMNICCFFWIKITKVCHFYSIKNFN